MDGELRRGQALEINNIGRVEIRSVTQAECGVADYWGRVSAEMITNKAA